MRNFIQKLAKSRSGATAIEYGLIAALIAVVIIAGATPLGTSINTKFSRVPASSAPAQCLCYLPLHSRSVSP